MMRSLVPILICVGEVGRFFGVPIGGISAQRMMVKDSPLRLFLNLPNSHHLKIGRSDFNSTASRLCNLLSTAIVKLAPYGCSLLQLNEF